MDRSYGVFVRNWWKEATSPGWPNGLEPDPRARKTWLHSGGLTFGEAREIAREYNATHDPGRYSRKAEIGSRR